MPIPVEHYQDCDDTALGRLARARVNVAAAAIDHKHIGATIEDAVRTGLGLDQFRDGCQCRRLRSFAVADAQRTIRKANRARMIGSIE